MKEFVIYEDGRSAGLPVEFLINLYSGQTFDDKYYAIDASGGPVNISGYAVRMQFKRTAYSEALVTLELGDGLEIDNNEISIKLNSKQTRAVEGIAGADVRFEKAGIVFFGLRFKVKCTPTVTRCQS